MSEGTYCPKCLGPVGRRGECSYIMGTCVNDQKPGSSPFHTPHAADPHPGIIAYDLCTVEGCQIGDAARCCVNGCQKACDALRREGFMAALDLVRVKADAFAQVGAIRFVADEVVLEAPGDPAP